MELLQKLKDFIGKSSDDIATCYEEQNSYRINTQNGAVIHCYRTGKVLFQGNMQAKEYLKNLWEKSGCQNEEQNDIAFSHKEKEREDAFEILSNIKPEYISRYLYLEREKKLRNNTSSFKNEDDLKNWFITEFSQWFIIYKDVEGRGYVNKKEFSLVADFILEPKQELIKKGINSFIGIEVKYINIAKDYFTKSTELSFQTLSYSYSNSEWLINNNFVSVDAFSIFTNLSFSDERKIFNLLDRYECWWSANLALINHANVGELRVKKHNNRLESWYMFFSGASYCKWSVKSGVSLVNPKVIGKARIGNIS